MVSQGDLVAARGERRGVQRAFAHFGAERTGIFLFSHVEHDFSDICLFQEKGDVQLRTEGGEGRKICGVILKIQIHRDRGQRERLGRKAAASSFKSVTLSFPPERPTAMRSPGRIMEKSVIPRRRPESSCCVVINPRIDCYFFRNIL